MKKDKPLDPPFDKIDRALKRFSKNAAWKDVVPFLLIWMRDNTPSDTKYSLEWWMKTYGYTYTGENHGKLKNKVGEQ
jgi:hypothetical protein